jgi:hypothetical protein
MKLANTTSNIGLSITNKSPMSFGGVVMTPYNSEFMGPSILFAIILNIL